ncbi:hypothetical protein [Anderseniella sp. Alg231-50]|uniref:hypothetical protein n=1 Tax=Anderseniella sp. Alg231-50 TaxID=1922226 RepID=UPI000D553173
MRSPSVFFLLAVAGTALSGCASGFDDAYIGSAAITDGPGGDGLSGDEPSGDPNGGDLPAGAGDNSIVFTDGSRVVDGSARTVLTINDDPDDSSLFASATVLVDPGQAIGFVGEQQVAIFEQKTTDPGIEVAGPLAATWFQPHQVEDSEYSEFRRISPSQGIDVELQYWDFTDGDSGTANYVAHFRDATNDQDAWFFGEADGQASRTTTDELANLGTPTLNYQGSYVGQAKTTGWGQASTYQSRDGAWRVQGHAAVNLDLGANELTGTLTPQFWEKTESDGTIVQLDVHRQPGDEYVALSSSAVDPGGAPPVANPADVAAFHTANIQLEGNITDAGAINGTAKVISPDVIVSQTQGVATLPDQYTTGGWVNGDQALSAATYGTGAEKIGGVFGVYAVNPSPRGGDTGINDDQRGTFDLQGGFGVSQGGDPIDAVPAPVPTP